MTLATRLYVPFWKELPCQSQGKLQADFSLQPNLLVSRFQLHNIQLRMPTGNAKSTDSHSEELSLSPGLCTLKASPKLADYTLRNTTVE